MKKLLAPSLFVLSLFVVACSGGSAAGTYELDKPAVKQAMAAAMPADAKADKDAAAAADKMLDQMVSSMNSTIELKADGTATMNMQAEFFGSKVDETSTGTWKLAGNKLTITAKDKTGKEDSKTVDYSNGSFAIEEGEGVRKMKLIFRRK